MPQLSRPSVPSGPRGLGLEVIPVTASFTWDTTYTDRVIRSDASGGITITLPADAPVGAASTIQQYGAGTVTVAAGTGATISSSSGILATSAQYDVIQVICVKIGVWTVRSQSGTGAYSGTFSGSTVTTTGIDTVSVANALTASTTQTLAAGTALTKRINRITTCANSGDAVTLPALAVGQSVDIYNDGAAAASVFPNSASVAIDGGSAGAAVTLTNAKRCRYTCVATNVVISAQLGAVSA